MKQLLGHDQKKKYLKSLLTCKETIPRAKVSKGHAKWRQFLQNKHRDKIYLYWYVNYIPRYYQLFKVNMYSLQKYEK